MSEVIWPSVMLVALMIGIFSGYPVAFVLAGVGILTAFAADVPILFLSITVQRIYSGILTNWLLVAIPMFIFMGPMLERSASPNELLRALAGSCAGAGRLRPRRHDHGHRHGGDHRHHRRLGGADDADGAAGHDPARLRRPLATARSPPPARSAS